MGEIKRLSADSLCWRYAPEQFAFESTDDLEDLTEVMGQERAVLASPPSMVDWFAFIGWKRAWLMRLETVMRYRSTASNRFDTENVTQIA